MSAARRITSVTTRASRLALGTASLSLAAAAGAQQPAPADSLSPAAPPAADRPAWQERALDRLSVSARWGGFQPRGGSELHTLLDDALTSGARALRPQLAGGALHVRLSTRWGVVVGAESGERTSASASRVQPAAVAGGVRQATRFSLTAAPYVGAEWQALRWRGAAQEGADRLRVVLGAGAGVARYALRQTGGFVDAARAVAFANDFRSSGRGGFGWASAGLEVPLRRWVALEGTLRQQAGSATMREDFASFDRLDLGGTRFDVGVRLSAARARRGR